MKVGWFSKQITHQGLGWVLMDWWQECDNFLSYLWSVCHPVIYSLTEIETETEIEIISLTESKRETEMFSKTKTKYKWKSERTKRNINWNENDFKTKMITNIGKKQAYQCFDLILSFPSGSANKSRRSSARTCATLQAQIDHAVPAWTSGRSNSARRRCHHLLQQMAGSLSTACPTGPRPGSCASIPGLRRMCSLYAAGLQLAAETDCLKIWKCLCFWNWTRTWCDCMTDRGKSESTDAC